MSRGKDIDIVVKETGQKPVKPDLTLEERIIDARDRFLSDKSQDVESLVTDSLTENYLLDAVGLKKDHWTDSRWTFQIHASNPLAERLRRDAAAAAARLVAGIDFSKVELTSAQVNAIRTAYNNELKHHVASAARELARNDAYKVVAKVLKLDASGYVREDE